MSRSVGVVMDAAGADADQARLHQLGYRQELKRGLSLVSNFAFSFSIISVLTGVTTTYGTGLRYGGPVSMTLGWLVVAAFNGCVALSMAEICSAYPTSGGLYYWSAKLAGKEWAPLASWVTGWFNIVGQWACTTSVDFSLAQLLQVIILLATGGANGGGYMASKYVVLAIYSAILILHGLINSLPIRWLSWFGQLGAFWNVAGAFSLTILIPAVAKERVSPEFIFTHFNAENGAGIHDKAYILAAGLLMSQYSLIGYDTSAHIIEETKNADWSGPIGIITSVALSTMFGWIYLIALTSIMTDIPYLLNPSNDAGGYAIAQALYTSFHRRYGTGAGALACLGVIAVAIFLCGSACITSNSRMGYAFSRDGAMPLSRVWHRVDSREVPLNVVWLSVAVAFVMALTSLGSQVAFQAMVSIATLGLLIACALPVFFRVTTARRSFVRGPFHLGKYGVVVGWVGVVWVATVTVLFSLPVAYPVAKETFNYTPVAVGGVLLLSLVAWVLHARFWFQGPVTNVDTYNTPTAMSRSGVVAMDAADADADQARLHQLGYRQELKRGLSLVSNFAFSFSIISVLTGVTTTYGTGLRYGGPVSMTLGWLVVSAFNGCVALSMAEICSAYPTSGGLYYWSAKLAGKEWAPLASWWACTTSVDFSLAQLLQVIILLATGGANGGGYMASKYVVLAIYSVILILHGLINSLPIHWLSWFGQLGAFWNVAGVFALTILIPSVAKERASPEFIFTHFNTENGMGIHQKAYILAVGLLMSQYSVIGYDTSAHMIEETKNADWSGPMGIITSVGLSTMFGWIYLVALTSIVVDIPYLLNPDNDASGYAIAQALYTSFHRRYGTGAGALACLGVIAVAVFLCGSACITSNSRMGYAFSRDGAMPLSRVWHRVDSREVPLNVVWLSVAVAFVMALTSLGSQVAFQAMVSVTTLGLYIAYALPVFFRVTTARKSFVPGPFHLGRYGLVVGWMAVVWVATVTVLFSLPVAYPVAKETFNYTPVAVGGVLLLSLVAWVFHARFWFQGPVTNVDARGGCPGSRRCRSIVGGTNEQQ
uniref:Amino acid permease n=1 Tax=Oryza barthii TaxID=65489 RepID=A0A0D3EYL1_9ORYZ